MNTNANHRIGIYAALLLIAGIVLSGPLGLIVVGVVHPQPAWQDAQTLAANYHPIQTLPFFARLSAGHRLRPADRHAVSALCRQEQSRCPARRRLHGGVYGLIFLNYICQTTFIPALLADYRPEYAAIIAAFSFTNPNSLMLGDRNVGLRAPGAGHLLLAPVFNRDWIERTTAWLMVVNGIISIAGGFITAGQSGLGHDRTRSHQLHLPGTSLSCCGAYSSSSHLYRREHQAPVPAAATA